MNMTKTPRKGNRRRRKGQKGQALVIFALMFVFLVGIVGLATDGAVAFAYSVSLERAASAAALSGAPYMPNNFASAQTRALAESRRNGWTDNRPSLATACSVATYVCVEVNPAGSRQLDVRVSATVPTFFMSALGIQPYRVTREAVAGYLPPIPLGQPGNQLGSTGAQLGGGNNFYVLRMKAQNKYRSEGDPYTTQPFETITTSQDVHTISANQGAEVPSLDCSTGTAGWQLPCKGGQNFRVTLPPGSTALGGGSLEVYNAGFGPDFGPNNGCDNLQGRPLAVGGQATCAAGGLTMREGTDDGFGGNDPNATLGEPLANAHCGVAIGVDCNSGAGGVGNRPRKHLYNAVAYTLMAVPNIFLRSDDVPLMQTRILPVDANNFAAATPTYVNVNDGNGVSLNQTYGASYFGTFCGICPANVQTYHSWDNITTEDGTTNGNNASSVGHNITTQVKSAAYGTYILPNGALREGTYRLRVDMLNSNGQCCGAAPEGDTSHGYALRIVKPGTLPYQASAGNECLGSGSPAPKCDIAGWEDMTLYSPISGAGGSVPLFLLPPEYKGQTITVDAYDVGDAPGTVNLSLIDPKTNAIATCGAGSVAAPAAVAGPPPSPPVSCQAYSGFGAVAATLNIFNQGHDRFSATPIQHVGPQFPSGGIPPPPDYRISHAPAAAANQAGEQSTTGGTGNYNGEWIRFEVPVSPTYDGNCGAGGCYWQLNYSLTAGANDTFAFSVSTKGGPLHLISS
jgi:hypothetical protein